MFRRILHVLTSTKFTEFVNFDFFGEFSACGLVQLCQNVGVVLPLNSGGSEKTDDDKEDNEEGGEDDGKDDKDDNNDNDR